MLLYKKATLHTALTFKEITSRLNDKNSGFHGLIQDDNFEIQRIINTENSFLPVIDRELRDAPIQGTLVTLTFRMPLFIKICMIAWLMFALTFLILTFLGYTSTTYSGLIPLFLVYPIVLIIFIAEYYKGLDKLKKLLDANEYVRSTIKH